MTSATQTPVCPWCGGTSLARARSDGTATEFLCYSCKMRHTRKAGDPDAYAFYPPDVGPAVAAGDDVPPLF
jgi:hypothetical protein